MLKELTAIKQIFGNPVLFIALFAWALAQIIKVPIEYARYRRLNWGLMFSSGGMPSSHSALMTSVTLGTGLLYGFDTPVFALAFAISMIVIYDAAGVRREAGRHAEKINILINGFFSGNAISEEQLKEVIGHTPGQVLGGVVLGIVITFLCYLLVK